MAHDRIRHSMTIGHLSKVSRADEEDQVIPVMPISSPTQIATHRKRKIMMDEHTNIEEHVQGNNFDESEADSSENTMPVINETRRKSKPKNAEDLYKLVTEVYERGTRSMELLDLIQRQRGAIPLSVAFTAAEYIQKIWEVELQDVSRSTQLINYIANVLHRFSPSIITVYMAVMLLSQLKRRYPNSKGERGCGLRLFTVALLISYRYLEHPGDVDETFYQQWSCLTGNVFQGLDLLRMEMEMVSFVKFNLYIPYGDFEYFVGRVFNPTGSQIVPRSQNIYEIGKSIDLQGRQESAEAAVPDLMIPKRF